MRSGGGETLTGLTVVPAGVPTCPVGLQMDTCVRGGGGETLTGLTVVPAGVATCPVGHDSFLWIPLDSFGA